MNLVWVGSENIYFECCQCWVKSHHINDQENDTNTVEPVLGDHPFCPAKTVAQDRWSHITGRTTIMNVLPLVRYVYIVTHSQAVGLREAGVALV